MMLIKNPHRELGIKILIFFFMTFLVSCGNSDDSVTVSVEPTDQLIAELSGKEYSIVLDDMNVTERNSSKLYQHKYHILKVEKDSLVVDSTTWKTVNRPFFEKHENDLGMEIVTNHNGKLSRVAQPVGFGWAIGNEKQGEWEDVKSDSTSTASNTNNSSQRRWRSSGGSFLFWYWMMRRPAYQTQYRGYQSAQTSGRPYYGTNSNGTTSYGTRSNYEKSRRSNFFSRRKSSAAWNKHTTQKTKRSTSRYKSSSSTRSRGGGTGK